MKEVYPLIIGGRPVETDDLMEVINPYDGSTIARVCRADERTANMAVETADKARGVIACLPSHRRAQILDEISSGISQRREELARLISLECGKPIRDSRVEVDRAVLTFRIASEEAVRIGGEVIPLDRNPASEGRWGITRRFPAGTVLGITPFNFPLNLVAHKIAPAIASGNPIILKPASKTPITALVLGEIIMEAGLPEGGLSVIPSQARVAEGILKDERIRVLSFTGSASTGWRLKSLAGDRKVILELGGNAGVIIDRDCDLDYTVKRCIIGSFSYAGQICISVQRIYIHQDIYDRFIDSFVKGTEALRMGDPLGESTDIGPMIDEENLRRVDEWVREAVDKGAGILTGGRRDGNFYLPTVLTDTEPDMKVSCMEVFAPVVTVSRIKDIEEGIRAVNDSEYGLQAGLFTNNLNKAYRAFEGLEVGGVIINDVPTYRVDHMPYGGVKRSGSGREGIRYAIEEMTELRLMVLNIR